MHGEPGIGKTHLLEALAERARAQGRRVLGEEALEPGVRATLQRLAPVTLILDDFQWAGEAAHTLLADLLRHPPRGPVLIALAYRSLPPALTGALEAAARHGRVHDLPLAPLTRAEADALLGRPAGALYRLSGGNPFYLLELARGEAVPAAVAAAVGQELAALARRAGARLRRRGGRRPGGDRPRGGGRRAARAAGAGGALTSSSTPAAGADGTWFLDSSGDGKTG